MPVNNGNGNDFNVVSRINKREDDLKIFIKEIALANGFKLKDQVTVRWI